MKTKYQITVMEDPDTGELILPFPDELITQMQWSCGDTLTWTQLPDGSICIVKKPQTPK